MTEQSSTWTMDDASQASNPGGIRVSWIRWLRHYPVWPFLWAASLIGVIALAWWVHWVFWIPAILLLGMNFLYWMRVKEHFLHGCINPAMVVSLEPMLIAVATDLSKGGGEYPAIRIIEKSLARIGGVSPEVGCRLATVALYTDGESESPHWASFDPRPVQCATGEASAIQAALKSIVEEEWTQLEEGLAKVPKPYSKGEFFLF